MIPWRESVLAFSALPDLSALILSADPAWIWSRDGTRLLWANPAGGRRLGHTHFSSLAARRWRAQHPLARTLDTLSRALPAGGSMARLRLGDDLHGLPVACRCRLVRAGEERGVLVLPLEGGGAPAPSLAEVAAFFSDENASVVLFDATGGVLAEGSPRASAAITPATPHATIAAPGGALRLFIVAIGPPSGDASSRQPPRLKSAPSPEGGRDPEPSVTTGAEPSGDAAPLPAPPLPAPPAKVGPTPPIPVQAGSGSESGQTTGGTRPNGSPEVDQRSVVVGRVERELGGKSVRFLWQTDAAGRVLFVSPGLAQVVGRNAEIVGERWEEASARLYLDPTGRIEHALKQRDTWSGLNAWWPIEGANVRVPVELTALPVFGPDQSFQGYRGFGILRPAEALMPAAFEARFGSRDGPPRTAEQRPPYEESTGTANVVPIRADIERLADQPRLTPQERNAFEEIAAALRTRVEEAPRDPERSTTDISANENAQAAPPSDGEARPAASGPIEDGPVVPLFPSPPDDERVLPEGAPAEEQPSSAASATEPPVQAGPDSAERHGAVHEHVDQEPATAAPDHAALERTAALRAELADARRRLHDVSAILDTATDGVIVLDTKGFIESVNASAEALFGLEAHEMEGQAFVDLLTTDSGKSALDYLSGLKDSGVASLLNEGREVEARAGGGSIPLFMTMGRLSSGDGGRFCAVLRDITHWKRTEAELLAARRSAEAASSQKSEFLARVSHEVRTPLNAIIGFAEVMIEERFGPVENERYREYLRDIRTSGEHVVSLVNDLLDIAKIEAGKLDLTFTAVPLNELLRETIGLMQPQANRAHVVLRSSLSREVPAIVADERTLRQIVLNLLSNSVKFTGPGGQVIASTSLGGNGEAVLRVRDTGEGMSEEELQRALEPFRQLSTASIASRAGTGLGLPLTKALVEANRASLFIRSARGEGTVVTIIFPPTRVLSE